MVAMMIPQSVKLVTDRLKSLPLEMSHTVLVSIISMFLLGRKSISDCVRSCNFTACVSSIANGIKVFPRDRLLRRIRKKVRALLKTVNDNSRYIFVLDDTANPKYGGKIYGVSRWGSSKGVYHGQRVLCLAIVDLKTKRAYPIDFVITKKSKEINMIDHAIALIEKNIAEGFPKLTVVTDSWFSSVKFMMKLLEIGCCYSGELKNNRKVKNNSESDNKWKSIKESFQNIKRERVITNWDSKERRSRKRVRKLAAVQELRLKKVTEIFRVVAMYNRRNAKDAFAYYLSTDTTYSAARIWELSRARWAIECIFRTCKQNLSFGKISCHGVNASYLAVEMPFYLYASIILEPKMFGGTEADSCDQILSRIRANCTEQTISLAIGGLKVKDFQKMKHRVSSCRAGKKPIISAAGK